MTEAQTALSRRVVACKGWRWLPGMMRLRATPPSRRDHLKGEGRVLDWGDTWVYAAWPVIPDLTDAATVGCLLALVRETWDDEGAYAMQRSVSEGGGWALWACPPGDVNIPRGTGATEAEALVAALESAP